MKRALRFIPAILTMAIIFGFSSVPAQVMPSFGVWDLIIKKASHVIGYATLTLSFFYAFQFQRKYIGFAIVFSIFYALTDEFHQSFVPGRHASLLDALVIDTGGSMLAGVIFWVTGKSRK
jgi:VanZ family protein